MWAVVAVWVERAVVLVVAVMVVMDATMAATTGAAARAAAARAAARAAVGWAAARVLCLKLRLSTRVRVAITDACVASNASACFTHHTVSPSLVGVCNAI